MPIKSTGPATTLFDEGKSLRMVTVLPCIAEEKIIIDLENTSTPVTFAAHDTVKQYKIVIVIPCNYKIV